VKCNVAQSTCKATPGNYWYAPGYVSSRNGCCHCQASCDQSQETSNTCTYYDAPSAPPKAAGCYNRRGNHQVDCVFAGEATDAANCTAGGGTFIATSSSCSERLKSGGCFDTATNKTACLFAGEVTGESACTGTWINEYSATSHPQDAGSTCMDRIDSFDGCYLGHPSHNVTCENKGATQQSCTGSWLPNVAKCGYTTTSTSWVCTPNWGCYNRLSSHSCECPGNNVNVNGVPINASSCNNAAGMSDMSPPPMWTEACACTCPSSSG
jgi:hypothetical protein